MIRNPLLMILLGGVFGLPLMLLSGKAAAAPGESAPGDFRTLVKQYGPAVVDINVVARPAPAEGGGGDDSEQGALGGLGEKGQRKPQQQRQQQQQYERSEGTGFVIQPDGLILTAAHVIERAVQVTVRLNDRRQFPAQVIGEDDGADVAIIKIDAPNLTVVKTGDPSALEVGERVLAIGAPFGFENSASDGIVSAKGRILKDVSNVPFIQTTVPTNPGNSGGPLFNRRGEVVGINARIYSRTGGYEGISFAIPIDLAMRISNQLRTDGHVTPGRLGVQLQSLNPQLAGSLGLERPEGALVTAIEPDSAADHAKIQRGDVIVMINGRPVSQKDELAGAIASLPAGSPADLDIWRNRKNIKITVTLKAQSSARNGPNGHGGGALEFSGRPLNAEEQRTLHLSYGILIGQVGSAVAAAGLQPGDVVLAVDAQPVTTMEELRNALGGSHAGKTINLLVQRHNTRVFVALQGG